MAKNIQEAEVIVTLNGTAAKKAVAELSQEFERLQKEALEAYKAGNDALGKKLDAQAQKLTKDIEITRRETKKFADIMKNLNGASLKELNSAAKQLRSEINKLTPGTKEFVEKSKQLQDVNTRINKLKSSFKGLVTEEKAATVSLKGLSEGFNRYFGMITAGIAAITGVSMALKKCAQDAAAMDDAYATVMKTTGRAHEEVEQLNDAFKKMDTRTAREELNKMAYEAGKLGFTGVENIRQFVEAADVINVALGDVLGEGATLEIAKLAQVFAQSTAALDNLDLKGRMLAVGSAVNQLGKESTASESYMVDFLGRLGGVATQAGISADQILGYASALDQMKQKVEMSATAFQKLIQQMIKKPEEFVEAARMPLDEFTKMMETDMNGAIKRVLEGFNQMGGFTQLVPVFKDMGLDGARAASVIAALAANLDKVSAAQATANEHIRLGTSMTREYNIMNSSMQAKLEKARKEFKDICIELGQKLNPIMLKSTKATTYLIKVLATYGKEIKAAVISVAAFTAVVKAHAIAQGVVNAVTKIGVTLKASYKAIVLALRVAYLKLTGQLEAAAVAQAELNAVMSTNVFGLIATAVAAVTVAIVHYTKKTKEATEATKKMQEIQDRINTEYAESASKVQVLTDILHNNNLAIDQRRDALKKLQEIVPAYHADLTREGELINDNTEALTIYLKNLEKVTRAKILEDEYTQATARVLKAEQDKRDAEARRLQALENAHGNTTEMTSITMQSSAGAYSVSEITPYGQAVRDVTAATNELTEAQQIQGQILQRIQQENGDAFATRKGELTAEEIEIQALNQEYQKLFREIREENRDNPDRGLERIAELQREQMEKIAEIRRKYKKALTEDEDPGGGGGGSGLSGKDAKKAFDEEIKLLEQFQREEEIVLKRSLMNREITQAEYNARMNLLTMKSLQERINIAKKYGQDYTKYASQLLDEQIKIIGDGMEEIQETMSYMPTTPKEGAIVDPQANEQFWEEIYRKRDDIVAQLKDKSLKKEYDLEMRWIEKLHEKELLSETEFQKAKFETKLKYLQEFAQQYNTIQEQASNFVNALKEYETQKAEAEYQAQLTAAGDNAEQREAVEAAYEQKKLDIQKKYADTEMVINIAKTVAAGALAAIQAFAQLGPIGGAVAAALIAVTTALEVATIVQQRNAIKNASVSSSGSSSAPKTGQRVMTGYSEGGETPWAPSDDTPVGIVHANEYVIPAWMKRREPVLIENLERYRKAGSHGKKGSASQGFADGGDTGMPVTNGRRSRRNGGGFRTYVKATVMDLFESGAIRVVLVRKDLSELDDQDAKFKEITSR